MEHFKKSTDDTRKEAVKKNIAKLMLMLKQTQGQIKVSTESIAAAEKKVR